MFSWLSLELCEEPLFSCSTLRSLPVDSLRFLHTSIDDYVTGLFGANCISMNLIVYKIVQTDSNHFHSIFRSTKIVYHSQETRKCSFDNMSSTRVWNISHHGSARNNRLSFEYACLSRFQFLWTYSIVCSRQRFKHKASVIKGRFLIGLRNDESNGTTFSFLLQWCQRQRCLEKHGRQSQRPHHWYWFGYYQLMCCHHGRQNTESARECWRYIWVTLLFHHSILDYLQVCEQPRRSLHLARTTNVSWACLLNDRQWPILKIPSMQQNVWLEENSMMMKWRKKCKVQTIESDSIFIASRFVGKVFPSKLFEHRMAMLGSKPMVKPIRPVKLVPSCWWKWRKQQRITMVHQWRMLSWPFLLISMILNDKWVRERGRDHVQLTACSRPRKMPVKSLVWMFFEWSMNQQPLLLPTVSNKRKIKCKRTPSDRLGVYQEASF